jgi:hypothetical protein
MPKNRKEEFTSAVKQFYDHTLTTNIFALAKIFVNQFETRRVSDKKGAHYPT